MAAPLATGADGEGGQDAVTPIVAWLKANRLDVPFSDYFTATGMSIDDLLEYNEADLELGALLLSRLSVASRMRILCQGSVHRVQRKGKGVQKAPEELGAKTQKGAQRRDDAATAARSHNHQRERVDEGVGGQAQSDRRCVGACQQ